MPYACGQTSFRNCRCSFLFRITPQFFFLTVLQFGTMCKWVFCATFLNRQTFTKWFFRLKMVERRGAFKTIQKQKQRMQMDVCIVYATIIWRSTIKSDADYETWQQQKILKCCHFFLFACFAFHDALGFFKRNWMFCVISSIPGLEENFRFWKSLEKKCRNSTE